jgi:ATP phosphoribosyltransferase
MPPLRLAIPNKGRLELPSAALLRQAGLSYEKTDRALTVPVRNMDVELLFVRTEDVCELVADGVATLGITGLDLLSESGTDLGVLAHLGFGRCRLTAAVPDAAPVGDIEGFDGLRIATSHPLTTERFFEEKGVAITTVPLRGSVEVAPTLDIADAIVDLVSSGSTMLVNGLRPVATILESEAVLVGPADVLRGEDDLPGQVITMFTSVVAARRKRYLLMNVPASTLGRVEEIIPGFDSPSIVPLASGGMVAVHSVVDAEDIWSVLPRLKAAGASGILVLPIEQLLP